MSRRRHRRGLAGLVEFVRVMEDVGAKSEKTGKRGRVAEKELQIFVDSTFGV